MIVRHLSDIIGSDREVKSTTWTSRRIFLAHEGMGFSLHDTIMHAGTTTRMCYRNHLEAVYCVAGEGVIEDCATGRRHAITPGMAYALDQHDEHIVHAGSELRLVCVFNPPVAGREVHDATGAYPPARATS